MKSPSKPIQIPDDIAARCTGPDQAERMDILFRKVIDAPRSAIVEDTLQRKAKNSPAMHATMLAPTAETVSEIEPKNTSK